MILYKKGERRYSEADPSDILETAADLLDDLGVPKYASILMGMALMARANGEYTSLLEAKRIDQQKSEDRVLAKPSRRSTNEQL